MKLRKTDQRFALYHHGFDIFLEFEDSEWNDYHRWQQTCRQVLGSEIFIFNNRVYTDGAWSGVHKHYNRRTDTDSKRIYLRGEKHYTLLTMAVPHKSEETFYL